jgi:hypothetical protein
VAGKLRKFRVHGAYKRKSDAKRKEKSPACHGACFIVPRMIRGMKRFLVLEKKGK